jgi:hypothetical protein
MGPRSYLAALVTADQRQYQHPTPAQCCFPYAGAALWLFQHQAASNSPGASGVGNPARADETGALAFNNSHYRKLGMSAVGCRKVERCRPPMFRQLRSGSHGQAYPEFPAAPGPSACRDAGIHQTPACNIEGQGAEERSVAPRNQIRRLPGPDINAGRKKVFMR